jgi:ketosteroid isomerase-like protein
MSRVSQENVEIVRCSYDAYVRGNLESARAAFDPAVEIYDHDCRTPVISGP